MRLTPPALADTPKESADMTDRRSTRWAAYCRVSTAEQARSGLGLEAQRSNRVLTPLMKDLGPNGVSAGDFFFVM